MQKKNTSFLTTMIFCFMCSLALPFWTTPAESADTQGGSVDLVTAIEQVAKRNIPAVVHIEVTERQEVANPIAPFENDPFFRYFFNIPKNMPKKFHREIVGLGTGMIMDAEGHILTNNHVVGGASKIQVLLSDGRQFEDKTVKVIGTDPKTDLAVIQITVKEPLPFVTFADSDQAGVGQWVVAIGHPRGLDETVTQGIISAKHRRGISDPSSYQDFLQTDAAINPGNSGGPLLNLQGEVVGVNAAIMSESGGFEGIGFAIPSNMAIHIAKQLIAHGKVERGWLGVSIQDLTPALAKSFGMSGNRGALVADVTKGGPADKAGMKKGDVVTSYQGKEIPDAGTLRNDVSVAPVGQEAKITVWRDGKARNLTVTVASREVEDKMLVASLQQRLGVSVRVVTPKEMGKYGLQSQQGVVIQKVEPKGPLGVAGFEKGDLILQVDKQSIDGPEELASMVSALPHNQPIVLLVLDHNSGETAYVRVVVP
jgi:serine protease Do